MRRDFLSSIDRTGRKRLTFVPVLIKRLLSDEETMQGLGDKFEVGIVPMISAVKIIGFSMISCPQFLFVNTIECTLRS